MNYVRKTLKLTSLNISCAENLMENYTILFEEKKKSITGP